MRENSYKDNHFKGDKTRNKVTINAVKHFIHIS